LTGLYSVLAVNLQKVAYPNINYIDEDHLKLEGLNIFVYIHIFLNIVRKQTNPFQIWDTG